MTKRWGKVGIFKEARSEELELGETKRRKRSNYSVRGRLHETLEAIRSIDFVMSFMGSHQRI